MSATHVSIEELLRFHDGDLAPDEITTIGAHLSACDECTAMAAEMFEAEALRTFAQVPERRTSVAWLPWAAGALAAAAMLVIVSLPRPHREPPVTPPHAIAQPAPWSGVVHAALAQRAIAPPPLYAAAHVPPDELRGSAPPPAAAKLLAPVGTVIDATRPQFRWSNPRGAAGTVTVSDGLTVVARSPQLHASEWTCDRDLGRGRVYTWQVRAGTEPLPPATFAIASADASAALAEARRVAPGDHLALGVLAARAGLREEATAELQQAADARPGDASIRALLQSVNAWR
jgi:hypothetical protein